MASLLSRGALATLLFALLVARSASAQSVRGVITERSTGQPIAGALVQLTDSSGPVGSAVLSGRSGAFALDAPAPGTFRLRVERVGFATELSDTVQLARGQTRTYPLALVSRVVTLDGLTARGRSRGCSIREHGETVARVWDEAERALRTLELTQASRLVSFDVESFRRELDPTSREVRSEQTFTATGRSRNPYQSVPIEELRTYGYVRMFPDSTAYYAPDANVLLSDFFLEDHCFRLARGTGRNQGSIGLSFRPTRRISKPDIEGTMWLDPTTSELSSVEYHYVNQPMAIPGDERFGGRIEFERIAASGAWIVRQWVIRMPVVKIHTFVWRDSDRTATQVTAVVEEGGRVVSVHDGPPDRELPTIVTRRWTARE